LLLSCALIRAENASSDIPKNDQTYAFHDACNFIVH